MSVIQDADGNNIVMINDIAFKGKHTENKKKKHNIDGANGWYRYDSCFALPVYGVDNKVERYNVFNVNLIIRHDLDGRKYLYDIINIKKETSNPLEHLAVHDKKPIS